MSKRKKDYVKPDHIGLGGLWSPKSGEEKLITLVDTSHNREKYPAFVDNERKYPSGCYLTVAALSDKRRDQLARTADGWELVGSKMKSRKIPNRCK
jgi:hypothetical protein